MKTLSTTALTEAQREILSKRTVCPEAFQINQEIVKALHEAMTSYKKAKLDIGFAKHINLDRDKYQVWMRQDNRLGKGYEINVKLSSRRFYKEATFQAQRETADSYAVEFSENISTHTWIENKPVDWREKMLFAINRFNDVDCYEWQENLKAIQSKLMKLEQQAAKIREEAEALIKATPAPVNDPLHRTQYKSTPHYYKELYPALFGWDK